MKCSVLVSSIGRRHSENVFAHLRSYMS